MSTSKDLALFIEEAVAAPFKPFGRDKEGWDCWGLIYTAYKDLLRVELPLYSDDYSSPGSRKEVSYLLEQGKNAPEWSKVDKPTEFDLVLLKISGSVWHVGLFVGRGWMLHAWRTGTHCIRLDSIVWNKRIEGYYRHVELAYD